MGLFDFFGKDSRSRTGNDYPLDNQRYGRYGTSNVSIDDNSNKGPVTIFKPTSFSDVEKIIDCLKGGKTAMVHLTEVKPQTAIRILDLLSGAVYALNGGVYEMQANIFMFSPSGVEIR